MGYADNTQDTKTLYEVSLFFKQDEEISEEIHLVLARNALEASAQLNKYYTLPDDKVFAGSSVAECTRYTTVIAKRKLYPIEY